MSGWAWAAAYVGGLALGAGAAAVVLGGFILGAAAIAAGVVLCAAARADEDTAARRCRR